MNAEILGTMLAQACYHFNFAYVIFVMNMVKHEEIKPNQIFMDHLKHFDSTIKDFMKKRVSRFRKCEVYYSIFIAFFSIVLLNLLFS